jgi:NTE family protein
LNKRQKIGLVLGGGGGKGAYQIGVWKALKEYKIDKYITYLSGTSIGSLNSLLFLTGDLDNAINVWSNITRETALTKKSVKDIFFKKSLYSRDGFVDLAERNVDFEKISNSNIKSFVTATPVSKNVEGAPTNFCLNGKSKEDILKYVLASSAIPVIFEPVVINGIKYRDGYMVDNTPVRVLKEEGCKLIFVVPLKEFSVAHECADENTMVIDFVSPYNDYGIIDGTLDFVSERAKMRMNHGYELAKQLINKLIDEGVIAITFKQKVRAYFIRWKKRKETKQYYYCLSKDEVIHRPE